jgi:hypothetical protein
VRVGVERDVGDGVALAEEETRARSASSSGTNGVPSPRKRRIAFDSAIVSPESSSSTGVRPAGFLAR